MALQRCVCRQGATTKDNGLDYTIAPLCAARVMVDMASTK